MGITCPDLPNLVSFTLFASIPNLMRANMTSVKYFPYTKMPNTIEIVFSVSLYKGYTHYMPLYKYTRYHAKF